ncbi:hypothetical protein BGW38_001298 [Lunasporangiospora selenospora]|uniref:BTB domain-containing protein n=1 Tax=Lunasporangiospora selenospora TaxID=979761 RepID=A0A9P6FUW0_9FUNG|nr:hypothetical protein BGW38_001298 [Lunasporangiospora selenospora]
MKMVFDGEDVSESGSNGNTSVSSSGRTSGNSRSKQVDDDDSCLYFQIWLSGARSRHPPEDVGAKIRTSGAPRRPLDQCRELLRRLRADESTADVEITIRPTQSEFSHGSTRQNGEGDEFVLEETEESQDEDEEEIEEIHQTVLGKRTISEVEGDGSNSEQDEGNVEDQSDHPKLALPSITPANIATYPQRTRDRQRLQAHGSTTPAALSRENTMVDERDAEMISSSQQTVMDAQDLLTSCQKRPKTKKANRQTTTTSTKARPKDRSSYLLTTSGAPTRRRFLAHKCILESSPFFERMLSGHFREGQLDRHTLRHQVELSSDMFAEEIMDVLLDYMYTREPIQDSDSTPERVALDRNLEVEDRSIDRPETNSAEQEQEQEQGGEDVHYYVSANVGLNLQSTMTEARCRARDSLSALPRAEEVRDGRNALTLQQWGALYRASIHLEDTGLQMQALTKVQEKLDPETTLDQVVSWGHQHGPIKTVMMDYLVEKRRDVFGDEQRNKLRPYLWANDALQVEALVELTSQIARR